MAQNDDTPANEARVSDEEAAKRLHQEAVQNRQATAEAERVRAAAKAREEALRRDTQARLQSHACVIKLKGLYDGATGTEKKEYLDKLKDVIKNNVLPNECLTKDDRTASLNPSSYNPAEKAPLESATLAGAALRGKVSLVEAKEIAPAPGKSLSAMVKAA